MPSVSILMNCLNGEKYLKQAIKSVLDQTFQDWELLFVDNCSSDRSREIILDVDDQRIKYFNTQQKIKLGAARKFGVNQAKANWIGFLDTDDLWEPDKLHRQLHHLKDGKYAMCYGGVREITEHGEIIRDYYPEKEKANISSQLRQYDINLVTPLVSRKFLSLNNLNFNENIYASEEYNLFLRILAKGKAVVLPEILGRWRIYSGTLTERSIQHWATDRLLTLKQLEEENTGISTRLHDAFQSAKARSFYYQARYNESINEVVLAKNSLLEASRIKKTYIFLYLLFLVRPLWKYLHQHNLKRILVNFKIIKKILHK